MQGVPPIAGLPRQAVVSERFPWQIDAVILALALLGLCLFAPSCCSVRPMGVGFLEGMGALDPSSAQKWQSEIERECGGGPVSVEPSAPSRSWWERFWDE